MKHLDLIIKVKGKEVGEALNYAMLHIILEQMEKDGVFENIEDVEIVSKTNTQPTYH